MISGNISRMHNVKLYENVFIFYASAMYVFNSCGKEMINCEFCDLGVDGCYRPVEHVCLFCMN